jgi:transposase
VLPTGLFIARDLQKSRTIRSRRRRFLAGRKLHRHRKLQPIANTVVLHDSIEGRANLSLDLGRLTEDQRGNKDDRFDAFVLADTLRTDRSRLRPLLPDTPATATLRRTCRARKDLVGHRVALANQLRAHLRVVFPGVVGLFAENDSLISLAFLTRFDCQDRADWLSVKRLAAWLAPAGYCGRVDVPCSTAGSPAPRAAPPVTTAPPTSARPACSPRSATARLYRSAAQGLARRLSPAKSQTASRSCLSAAQRNPTWVTLPDWRMGGDSGQAGQRFGRGERARATHCQPAVPMVSQRSRCSSCVKPPFVDLG